MLRQRKSRWRTVGAVDRQVPGNAIVPTPGTQQCQASKVAIRSDFRGESLPRTGLIVGESNPTLEPLWKNSMRAFPNWPGFSPERCAPAEALARYVTKARQELENFLEEDANSTTCVSVPKGRHVVAMGASPWLANDPRITSRNGAT